MALIQNFATKYHYDPKSEGYWEFGQYRGLDGLGQNYYATLVKGTSKTAVFRSVDNDVGTKARVYLEGKGLKYSQGYLIEGTITKASFVDSHGEKTWSLKNLDVPYRALYTLFSSSVKDPFALFLIGNDTMIGTKNADDLRSGVGRDTIKGLAGDDYLDGYTGKDTLIGGSGNDTFAFKTGYGHDKITDFDAKGGVGHQDDIRMTYEDFDSVIITQSGKDTVISLNDHDSLTLANVDHKLITVDDFQLYFA